MLITASDNCHGSLPVSFLYLLYKLERILSVKTLGNLQEHQPFCFEKRTVVLQEIFKMFMNQISLKALNIGSRSKLSCVQDVPFFTYPRAIRFFKRSFGIELWFGHGFRVL